jgi:hypothetical protein
MGSPHVLLVAGRAGHQSLAHGRVLVAMALVQAKAHVDTVRELRHGHLADVAVAGLAVLAGSNVRLVGEMDEIRKVDYLGPDQRLACLPGRHEPVHNLLSLRAGDLYVVMTTHTFLNRGDGGYRAVERPWMAKKAGDAGGYVLLVVELERAAGYRRRCRGASLQHDTDCSEKEQQRYEDDEPAPT